MGRDNLQQIIGLLEIFACEFIKAICGEHLDVRLHHGSADGKLKFKNVDGVAREILEKEVNADELHYYQRLFRSLLLAFASEDGIDEQTQFIRRLRGEDGR